MNTSDSISTLIELIRSFCEARDWDQFHTPDQLAIGVSTEAAELLALFRFKTPNQITALIQNLDSRQRIADELADVFFFILRFSQITGIDLDDALRTKLHKNELKYPVELSRGKNMKYDEL